LPPFWRVEMRISSKSPLRDEFFAVADFIVFNDPAVKSYLVGEEVSTAGRKGNLSAG
jgi:hypothetical protein